jgi:hypothetical protein
VDFEVAVAVNIYPFDAVAAEGVIANGVERMFWVEEFLEAHSQVGVILLTDKAFKHAVLHRRAIPFKNFMDFCPAPVIFDVVGNKNKLHGFSGSEWVNTVLQEKSVTASPLKEIVVFCKQ